MESIYDTLLKDMGSLKDAEEAYSEGMDDFLSQGKAKVASLSDLSEFLRLSQETLVHKSKKDLWRISEDKEGQVVIERLFNPNTKEPIKI